MPALRKGRRSVEEQVRTELQQIRCELSAELADGHSMRRNRWRIAI